jgi:hypothetical protein
MGRAPAHDVSSARARRPLSVGSQPAIRGTRLAPVARKERFANMTRFSSLCSALVLTGGAVAASIAACAGRTGAPGAPGEMAPAAPRPDTTPLGAPAPGTEPARAASPGQVFPDGGVDAGPGAVSMRRGSVMAVPTPEFSPAVTAPRDAGDADGYSPPLPPIPDAKLPDANIHPSLTN